MSYSFTVRAATKEILLAKAQAEMDAVAATQALHDIDKAQAMQNATAIADLVDEEQGQDLVMAMNGSVSARPSDQDGMLITGVSVGCSVWLARRDG